MQISSSAVLPSAVTPSSNQTGQEDVRTSTGRRLLVNTDSEEVHSTLAIITTTADFATAEREVYSPEAVAPHGAFMTLATVHNHNLPSASVYKHPALNPGSIDASAIQPYAQAGAETLGWPASSTRPAVAANSVAIAVSPASEAPSARKHKDATPAPVKLDLSRDDDDDVVALEAKIAQLYSQHREHSLGAANHRRTRRKVTLDLQEHLHRMHQALSRPGRDGQWTQFVRNLGIPKRTAENWRQAYSKRLEEERNRANGTIVTPPTPLEKFITDVERRVSKVCTTSADREKVLRAMQRLLGGDQLPA